MIQGSGLGLREAFFDEIIDYRDEIDFLEIVPENSMHLNFRQAKQFEEIVQTFPTVAHGLSLSLGDPYGLNTEHIKTLKNFLDRYGIATYSEHLSFTSLDGRQTYELLPLPMTQAVVQMVVDKIAQLQEILQRTLVIENPTYYTALESTMDESDFINAILKKSGAKLLLDINNVFVNGHNHGFDPQVFIDKLDLKRVAYCHIAGHMEYRENLFIDTHGMPVKEEVWRLMRRVVSRKTLPVLLERDNNIPPLAILMDEFRMMRQIVSEVRRVA